MKKVLSLLLVCAMIFSLALVGSAAGEGYTLVAGKYAQVENEESGEMETVFTADSYNELACGSIDDSTQVISLKVTTNTAASGGYIAIDYDETKVMPVRFNSTLSKVFNTFSDTTYYNFATAGTGVTTVASKDATYPDKTNIVYSWTGAMSAGDVIAYIHFACIDGVTTDDFNAETFVISEDADFLAAYKLGNGGASLDYQGTTYKASEGTLSTALTYPNSDVAVGGGDDNKWEAGEESITDEFKADLLNVKVNGVAVDYVRAVAVFGKNAAGTTYTVKFGAIDGPGRKFEGEAVAGEDWAMVLYDDGSATDENGKPVELISSESASYPYTVEAADGTTWSGSATVFTK